jgi:hypothetical protein
LAHTYLALGQKSLALGEYEVCQNCHPPSDVADACQGVLGRLAASTGARSSIEAYSRATSPSSHEQYLNKQRNAVIDQSLQDANRINANTLKAINESTNTYRGLNSLDWNSTNAEKERARTLQQESQKQSNEIMEAARKKARELK